MRIITSDSGKAQRIWSECKQVTDWETFCRWLVNGENEYVGGKYSRPYSIISLKECPGRRRNDNFAARYGLQLDADNAGQDYIEALTEALGDVTWLSHTTASHTAEAPRWRTLIPLDRPVNTPFESQSTARWVIERVGAERFDSQASVSAVAVAYAPAWAGVRYEKNDGGALEVDVVLERMKAGGVGVGAGPDAPPSDAPDSDLRALEPLEVLDRLQGVYAALRRAERGERNHALNLMSYTAAGLWARPAAGAAGAAGVGVLEAEPIKDELRRIAVEIGLSAREIGPTIESGWRSGVDHPIGDGPDSDSGSGLGRLDQGFWQATPMLLRIQRAAHARGISAPVVLAAVFAEIALRVPVHVVLPAVVAVEQVLNFGVALLGASAASKSSAMKLARELLGVDQAAQWYGGIGSGEGLIDAFYRLMPDAKGKLVPTLAPADERRFMLVIDEAEELKQVKDRSKVPAYLRSGIGGGGALSNTNTLSGGNRRSVPADSYRLVCLMGVHPDQADIILADRINGFPQRFLFVDCDDAALPEDYRDLPQWDGEPLGWELPAFDWDKHVVRYPDAIRAEVLQRNLDKSHGKLSDLEGHAMLVRLKLATLLAVLHGEVDITEQWWSLAGVMSEASIAAQHQCLARMDANAVKAGAARLSREKRAQAQVEDEQMTEAVTKVVRKLRSEPGRRFTWRECRPPYRVRQGLETEDIADELRGQVGVHVEIGRNESNRGRDQIVMWFDEGSLSG